MRLGFLEKSLLFLGLFLLQAELVLPAESQSGSAASAPQDPLAISAEELETALGLHLKEVDEFNFIRELAEKMNVRAYLFGGTAASYGHYVKWDLQRKKGDTRFQPDRFDYDYADIYRSTQDADIVIDGSPADAVAFQHALMVQFPHLQGERTVWEVRLLTEGMGGKTAILNNRDFLDQNTDSNSVGLIEITSPYFGGPRVHDLRAWEEKYPPFFEDIRLGKLHFYHSPTHQLTSRARRGDNPPIFSVVRYLIKAFQFGLEITGEDRATIQEIIDRFHPSRDLSTQYAKDWMERNGRKLVQNAVDVEYAMDTLDALGLRAKLISTSKGAWRYDVTSVQAGVYDGSLAYWLNKEPLRSRPLGRGHGRTAKSLGLDIVAHDTRGFLAYESLTRSHTGNPNAFISRRSTEGEAAYFGDGFYTMPGRQGAVGSGLTVRYRVHPDAKEGTDFKLLSSGAILFFNRLALEVIPESFQLSAVDYFRMLFGQDQSAEELELGAQFKLRRKIQSKLGAVSGADFIKILDDFERYIQTYSFDKLNRNAIRQLVVIARQQPSHAKKLTTILSALFRQYSKNNRDHLELLLTDLKGLGGSEAEKDLLLLVSAGVRSISDLELVLVQLKPTCSKEGLVQIINERLIDLSSAENDPLRLQSRLISILDWLSTRELREFFDAMRNSLKRSGLLELLFVLQSHYISSNKINTEDMDKVRLAIRLTRHQGYDSETIEAALKVVPEDLFYSFAEIIVTELRSPAEFFKFLAGLKAYDSKIFRFEKWLTRLNGINQGLQVKKLADLKDFPLASEEAFLLLHHLGKFQESGDGILHLISKAEALAPSKSREVLIDGLISEWVNLKLNQLDAGQPLGSGIAPGQFGNSHELFLKFMKALIPRQKDFGVLIRSLGEIFPTRSMANEMFEAVKSGPDLVDLIHRHPEFYPSLRIMPERVFGIPLTVAEFLSISKDLDESLKLRKNALERDEFWKSWGKSLAIRADSAQSLIDFFSWVRHPGPWAFHWLQSFIDQHPNLKQIMDLLRTLRDKENTPVGSLLVEGSPLFQYIFVDRRIHINAHDLRQLVDLHAEPSSFLSKLRHFIKDSKFSGIGLAQLLTQLDEKEWTGALLPTRLSDIVAFIRMHPQPGEFLVRVWPELVSRDPPNSILIEALQIADEKQEFKFIGEEGLFEKEFFDRAFFSIDFLKVVRQIKSPEILTQFLTRRVGSFFQREPNAQEIFDLKQVWMHAGLKEEILTEMTARLAATKAIPGLFERGLLTKADLSARLQTDPMLELTVGERRKLLGSEGNGTESSCRARLSRLAARFILRRH